MDDNDVERYRRAHLNDMENIYLFLIVGTLYMFANPNKFIAINVFRLFAGVRVAHTIIYLGGLPQKLRGMCFVFGLLSIAFMSLCIITTFM